MARRYPRSPATPVRGGVRAPLSARGSTRILCWFAASLLAGCLDGRSSPAATEPEDEAGRAPGRDAAASTASSGTSSEAGAAGDAGASAASGSEAGTASDAGAAGNASQFADASGADASANGGLGPMGRPLGVADCYSPASSSHPATLHYLQAAANRDLAGRASALEELKVAAAAHPEEEEFALLLGIGSVWRLAESYDLELLNPLVVLDTIDTAERELKRAYELCPTDHRIPAWLGPLKGVVGKLLGDPALFDEGAAIVERAVPHYPDFLEFTRVLLYADRPTDDPDFMKAVAGVNVDCAIGAISPACSNTPRTPHNVEGGALYIGDLRAKMQDRAGALALYTGAKRVPEYETWKYKDLIEERIRSIDERIAAAASRSTSDDLESAWESPVLCSLCHQAN